MNLRPTRKLAVDHLLDAAMGAGWVILAAVCWIQDGPKTAHVAFLGMFVWALTAQSNNEWRALAEKAVALVDYVAMKGAKREQN